MKAPDKLLDVEEWSAQMGEWVIEKDSIANSMALPYTVLSALLLFWSAPAFAHTNAIPSNSGQAYLHDVNVTRFTAIGS